MLRVESRIKTAGHLLTAAFPASGRTRESHRARRLKVGTRLVND
jgi:hypothetical protein